MMLKSRILCILAIILAIALFLWVQTPEALLLLVVALCVPACMFVIVRVSAAATRIELDIDTSYQIGERNLVPIRLVRGLPFELCTIEMDVLVSNTPFSYTRTHHVQVMLSTRHPLQYLSLLGERYGTTHIEAGNAYVYDPLRLFRGRIHFERAYDCVVHPQAVETDVNVEQTPKAQLFGDSFDNTKSGNDVGEVFDVREYRDGDSMASIHWKLSRKFDTLISREFSKSADYDIALLACGCLEQDGGEFVPARNNGVAAVATSISESLLRAGVFHDTALIRDQFVRYDLVADMPTCAAFSEDLMMTPITKTAHEVTQVLMNAALGERFAKVVLVTCYYDEALWSHLAHDVDLVVIVITELGESNINRDQYGLYTLQAERLGEHVQNISI